MYFSPTSEYARLFQQAVNRSNNAVKMLLFGNADWNIFSSTTDVFVFNILSLYTLSKHDYILLLGFMKRFPNVNWSVIGFVLSVNVALRLLSRTLISVCYSVRTKAALNLSCWFDNKMFFRQHAHANTDMGSVVPFKVRKRGKDFVVQKLKRGIKV